MPETLPDSAYLLKADLAKDDGFSGKVWSELNLLSTGISDGFKERTMQAYENKGMTALEFGSAAVVGMGLAAMKSAGGRYAAIANGANYLLMAGFAADVTTRALPSAAALSDNWSNPQNFDKNKSKNAYFDPATNTMHFGHGEQAVAHRVLKFEKSAAWDSDKFFAESRGRFNDLKWGSVIETKPSYLPIFTLPFSGPDLLKKK